jgi:hypothetical protein
MQPKFNGVIKEILEQPPSIDLQVFLEDTLRLPKFKAEELAGRIKKQHLKAEADATFRRALDVPAKMSSEKSNIYSLDCLSEKEFVFFLKWLLGELGYVVTSERHVDWGFDLDADKDQEKTLFLTRKYPKNCLVSEAAFLLSAQSKQQCNCHKTVFLSTADFSQKAYASAQDFGVELWNPDTVDKKIAQAKQNAALEQQERFPQYNSSLMESLLKLDESGSFIVEPRSNGKFDLHLPNVKFPLLTFQTQNKTIKQCICRIKNNQPVSEAEGTAIISTDRNGNKVGPEDAEAYELITQYLKEFLN